MDKKSQKILVLVIGAGGAGDLIAQRFAEHDPSLDIYECIGFVDDDIKKVGKKIHGFEILGTLEDIPRIVIDHKIVIVFCAIVGDDGNVIRRVVDIVG